MLVKMRAFGGIAPKLNPRYLPEERAQTAINVDSTRQGALLPINGYGDVRKTFPNGHNSKKLFRSNLEAYDEVSYWISSTVDASFCRGQIIDDDFGIIYLTLDENNTGQINQTLTPPLFGVTKGQDAPAPNDNTPSGAATSGIIGINKFYGLGVPAPPSALSVEISAPATVDGLSREFRSYVYTYVWKVAGREMESRPSPPSTSEGYYLESDSTIEITGIQNPAYPSDYPADLGRPRGMAFADVAVRIYRSVGGEFLLVNTTDLQEAAGPDTITFADTVASEDLGEPLPSNTWNMPPRNMRLLTNLANGIMAGAVDKNIYFCEPYIPHAWPIAYSVSVDAPIVGMAALDTTLVVLTKERPYFIQGSSPEFMTVVQADAAQSCISERSIASMNGEVYFASPDGLMATSPRGTRNVTESLFSYRQWNELLDPTTIHGYTQDQKYFGFHDSGSFIYDVPTREFVTTDLQARAAYEDKRQDKLFVVPEGTRDIQAWGDGAAKRATWKSKIFGMPREVSFGFIQLESEQFPSYALAVNEDTVLSTRLTVWVDGVLTVQYRLYDSRYRVVTYTNGDINQPTFSDAVVIPPRNIMRLPPVLGRDWEFQVESDYEVFSVAVGQSGEEMAGA